MRLHPTKLLIYPIGYHQGRLLTYLQNVSNFLVDGSRLSPQPAYRYSLLILQSLLVTLDYMFCALPQSEAVFVHRFESFFSTTITGARFWTSHLGHRRLKSCPHFSFMSGLLLLFLHEQCIPTSKFAMTVLSKCVCQAFNMRPNEFEVSAEFASLLIYFAKSSAETAWHSATDMLLMFKNTSCWNSFKLVKILRIINTHKAMPSLRTIGATRP